MGKVYATINKKKVSSYKRVRKYSLYGWFNVLCDYTSGIAFAYALDEESARKMVKEHYSKDNHCDTKEFDSKPEVITKSFGFTVPGGG